MKTVKNVSNFSTFLNFLLSGNPLKIVPLNRMVCKWLASKVPTCELSAVDRQTPLCLSTDIYNISGSFSTVCELFYSIIKTRLQKEWPRMLPTVILDPAEFILFPTPNKLYSSILFCFEVTVFSERNLCLHFHYNWVLYVWILYNCFLLGIVKIVILGY